MYNFTHTLLLSLMLPIRRQLSPTMKKLSTPYHCCSLKQKHSTASHICPCCWTLLEKCTTCFKDGKAAASVHMPTDIWNWHILLYSQYNWEHPGRIVDKSPHTRASFHISASFTSYINAEKHPGSSLRKLWFEVTPAPGSTCTQSIIATVFNFLTKALEALNAPWKVQAPHYIMISEILWWVNTMRLLQKQTFFQGSCVFCFIFTGGFLASISSFQLQLFQSYSEMC